MRMFLPEYSSRIYVSIMENLIYWKGTAIGIDCGSFVNWFPSTPHEAIKAWFEQMDLPNLEVKRFSASSLE
jgi:hypothetical protein